MTIDQAIALSASIGACLSAFATFLTVRQMRQQREASYQPELVLTSTTFEASKDPLVSGLLPTHWAQELASTDIDHRSAVHFSLPLCNVGLGAAKGISISWSFPIEEMVSQANELAQRTLTPAYFSLDDGALSLKSESLGAGTSMWKNQQHEYIDYVLPMTVQKEQTQARLPHAFITLSSALLFLLAKEQKHKWTRDLIGITATLRYRDISDKQHTAVIDIKLSVEMISSAGAFFVGHLEPKKQH